MGIVTSFGMALQRRVGGVLRVEVLDGVWTQTVVCELPSTERLPEELAREAVEALSGARLLRPRA
jgi:hypothetical protein